MWKPFKLTKDRELTHDGYVYRVELGSLVVESATERRYLIPGDWVRVHPGYTVSSPAGTNLLVKAVQKLTPEELKVMHENLVVQERRMKAVKDHLEEVELRFCKMLLEFSVEALHDVVFLMESHMQDLLGCNYAMFKRIKKRFALGGLLVPAYRKVRINRDALSLHMEGLQVATKVSRPKSKVRTVSAVPEGGPRLPEPQLSGEVLFSRSMQPRVRKKQDTTPEETPLA